MLTGSPTTIRQLPFYGSYSVFERIIGFLKREGIPDKIDSVSLRDALSSEAARGVIGLMGNGWTDSNQAPTADLRKLVAAYGEPSWKATLKDVLLRSYAFVPGDWSKITPDELRAAFLERAGRDVGVLKSCERFFLAAIQEVGIRPSEEFSYRTTRMRHGADMTDHYKHVQRTGAASKIQQGQAKIAISSGVTTDNERVLQLLDLVDDPQMPEKVKAAAFTLISYFKQRARNAVGSEIN